MSTILDRVTDPSDLKSLSPEELLQLCQDLRAEIIQSVHQTGGHFASNLGVVELTVALHYLFDSPRDKLIWDVGHQGYVHKLLTGRRNRFNTIRQLGGISGFLNRDESAHDAFGAGHAATSVSAALGMAVARDLTEKDNHVVAVIGDGAMTCGLAFEAINNAGHLNNRLIVILNDNEMSISPNVGALSKYLNRMRTDARYIRAKSEAEQILPKLPLGELSLKGLKKVKKSVKDFFIPTMIWEELGFTYLGPVDGHDLNALIETIGQAKQLNEPVLVHIRTVKGKGFEAAETDPVKLHALSPKPKDGVTKSSKPTYSNAFAQTLINIARQRDDVVAITAAMREGTGLVPFEKEFPSRYFDVGIAEGHAVTFAAGLATQGIRPFVAIYSTFLQRAFDGIIHDVAIQNLPVIFCLDRGGLVGDDGRTHQGLFDFAYMRCVPNMVVMSPKDENELQNMMWTSLTIPGPSSIRYPRGSIMGVPLDTPPQQIPVGKAELLRQGQKVAILTIGPSAYEALKAADTLSQEDGLDVTVVNARFVKPLDKELILELARTHDHFVTVEEHVLMGGFGSAVTELLNDNGMTPKVIRLGIADEIVDHGPQDVMRAHYDLDAAGIVRRIRQGFPELHLQLSPIIRASEEKR